MGDNSLRKKMKKVKILIDNLVAPLKSKIIRIIFVQMTLEKKIRIAERNKNKNSREK